MLQISLDGGMQEEYFAASQSIVEDRARGRQKPYFQRLEKSPLELAVQIAFQEEWTDGDLRALRRWLTEPHYYAPLIFSSDPEKIYYALYVDEPRLIHNARNEGYITLRFRCNDGYAYSPLMMSEQYDWEDNPTHIGLMQFTAGIHIGTVTNEWQQLTLAAERRRWSDLPPDSSWENL
ncbi:phage tail family protein [Paenibacillus sp. J5C_2022]|nr:phage tail family protein [Paenibacillus sp. J5C2022]